MALSLKIMANLDLVSTEQKMKFSIKDFFSKCDQIRSILRIWSNLLKKSLLENFIFCAVFIKHFDSCLFWVQANAKIFNHTSILSSSEINIGCQITLWCHKSTSVYHPGISSSANAVKFKLTPEIILDKRCWLIISSLWSRDRCVFYKPEIIYADISKNWKIMSSVNLLLMPNRRPPN